MARVARSPASGFIVQAQVVGDIGCRRRWLAIVIGVVLELRSDELVQVEHCLVRSGPGNQEPNIAGSIRSV